MKKIFLALPIIYFLYLSGINAQNCPLYEPFSLRDQAAIDTFQRFLLLHYPNCMQGGHVKKSISIRGRDITNFNGLNFITSVDGLSIWGNQNLQLIEGLNNLTFISGSLSIGDNPKLTSISGLSNLVAISNELFIGSYGLYIGNSVIDSQSLLTTINGLNNLTSVGGYFQIKGSHGLVNINSFNNLTSIGGNLNFQSNNNLTTINSFNNLASIGGSLYVNDNNNLTTLSGFNNLGSIGGVEGGGLYIFNNSKLTTLSSFNNLANLRYSLSIHNNIKLSDCGVPFICNLLNKGIFIYVLNNAVGCSTITEIQGKCGKYKVETYNSRAQKTSLIETFSTLLDPSLNRLKTRISTDETEATILKIKGDSINSNVILRLKDNTSSDKYGALRLKTRGTTEIEYAYRHPSQFQVNDSLIEFEIVNQSTNKVLRQFRMNKALPPLLLLHGIYSFGESFAKMKDKLLATKLYTYYQISNPSYPNNIRFANNLSSTQASVNDLLAQALYDKVSAGKVDVVAHSMGGILTRLYYQGGTYQNDIRKLITINTPHSGSQLANVAINSRIAYLAPAILGHRRDFTIDAAIEDLRVDAPIIRNILNNPSYRTRGNVYNHAIYTDYQLPDLDPRFFLRPGASYLDLVVLLVYRHYCGFSTVNDCWRNRVFNSEYNDAVVALSSQKGGISGTSSTYVSSEMHMGVQSNLTVINSVITLLRADPKTSTFTINGFNPPVLNGFRPDPINIEYRGSSTLKINWPDSTIRKNSQDTLQIKVKGSNDIKGIVVSCNNIDSFWIDESVGNQATFVYKVPKNIVGELNIAAWGFDSLGYRVTDSSFITINTPTNIPLDSISLKEQKIKLYKNVERHFDVFAYYRDSSIRNITTLSPLSISSKFNRFSRSSTSLLKGLVIGIDTLTAIYGGDTVKIPVVIDTLTTVPIVIPVELLGFNAKQRDNDNLLEWETASERNNQGYEIQRSLNAQDWENIGFVIGYGNSNEKKSYKFIDTKPFNISYYRLRQIDFDGQETFSKVASVVRDANDEVFLFPNPTTGKLNVKTTKFQPNRVRIFNNLGQILVDKTLANDEIDISSLPIGIYQIELSSETKKVQKRVIKN